MSSSDRTNQNRFFKMPIDIRNEIARYLTLGEITAFAATTRDMQRGKKYLNWRKLLKRDFNYDDKDKSLSPAQAAKLYYHLFSVKNNDPYALNTLYAIILRAGLNDFPPLFSVSVSLTHDHPVSNNNDRIRIEEMKEGEEEDDEIGYDATQLVVRNRNNVGHDYDDSDSDIEQADTQEGLEEFNAKKLDLFLLTEALRTRNTDLSDALFLSFSSWQDGAIKDRAISFAIMTKNSPKMILQWMDNYYYDGNRLRRACPI